MQGYNFDTFTRTPSNQMAMDTCLAIATFEQEPGRPVLLFGPEGSGKSHLLWSIVKRVRLGREKVGLALIMAHEFPEKVKNLAKDAGPIASGRKAMLLVDGLEEFRDESEELEAVVRVFLHHGHHVVLTSSVHPDQLIRLTPQFRALLKLGEVIDIQAPDASQQSGTVSPDVVALEAEVKSLKAKRQELEKRLAKSAVSSTEIESLRRLVKNGLSEQDRLKAALTAAEKRADQASENAKKELSALRYERDALKTALEKESAQPREQDLAELEELRQRIRDLGAELDRTRQIAESGKQAAEELETLRQRTASLEDELETARKESESKSHELAEQRNSAASDSDRLRRRIEKIVSELDSTREEAASGRQAKEELSKIRQRTESLETEFESVRKESEAKSQELAEQIESATIESDKLRERIEELVAELDDTQEKAASGQQAKEELETQRQRTAHLEAELETARKVSESKSQELAEQIESATIESDKLREQIEELGAELNSTREEAASGRQAKEELETQRQRTARLEAELESARREFESKSQEFDNQKSSATTESEKLRLQIEELKTELDQTQEEAASGMQAKEELEVLRQRYTSLEAELENVRKEYESKSQELAEQSTSATTEFNRLRQKNKELEAELESAREEVKSGQHTAEELAALRQRTISLEAELETACKESESKSQELIEQRKSAVADTDRLHQRIEDFAAELDAVRNESDKRAEHITELESKLLQQDELEARLITAREELSALRIALEESEKEAAILRNAESFARNEADTLKVKVANLEADLNEISVKRTELEKQLVEAEVSAAEIESLRESVQNGISEQERLKAALTAAETRADQATKDVKEELAALRFRRDALKEALDKAMSQPREQDALELEKLRRHIQELEAELDSTKEEVEIGRQATEELETMRQRTNSLEDDLEVARKEIESKLYEMAEQSKAAIAESDRLHRQIGEITAKLEASRNKSDKLAERIEELESTAILKDELDKRLATANAELAVLQTTLESGEKEAIVLRNAEAFARDEAEKAQLKVAELEARIVEYESLQITIEELTKERDEAREVNRRLAAQAEAVLDQIEATKNTVSGGQQGLLASFQQLLYDFHAHGLAGGGGAGRERLEALLGDADSLAEAFQEQMLIDRAQFAEELERAQRESDYAEELLEIARTEQGRLRVALDAAEGRTAAMDSELANARKQLAFQTAEMDALRQEAASQVASAHMQAGEMEHRIVELKAALQLAREAGEAISSLGDRLGGFSGFVEELREITTKFAILREAGVAQLTLAEDAEDDQAALFEAFESLPRPRIVERDLEPESSKDVNTSEPVSLIELVEEALSHDIDEHRAG